MTRVDKRWTFYCYIKRRYVNLQAYEIDDLECDE